jgi:hypothetical protein
MRPRNSVLGNFAIARAGDQTRGRISESTRLVSGPYHMWNRVADALENFVSGSLLTR